MVKARNIRKAVVPAAGKGTRLSPLTKAIAKEMLPLGRKPLLEIIVGELITSGITEALFIISEEKTSIPAYFKDYPGITIDWTIQKEQKGLADAILCSEEYVGGDPFLVALGDALITPLEPPHATSRVLDCYSRTNAEGVIIVQSTPLEESPRYGMVRPARWDGQYFEIDLLVEKPSPEKSPGEYAIAGRYAFGPSIFDCIKRTRPGVGGELQITDSICHMVDDGRPVWGVPLIGNEARRDIGTFPAYYEAFILLARSDPDFAEAKELIDRLTSGLG